MSGVVLDPLCHNLKVAMYLEKNVKVDAPVWPPSTAMQPCGCGRDGCDAVLCIVCGGFDCKWPGRCMGRCRECGASAMQGIDGFGFDCYCSSACSEASEARARAEGRVIDFADITQERANELLNTMGLQISGVGPVISS